eukprot:scaffold28.g7583.t1
MARTRVLTPLRQFKLKQGAILLIAALLVYAAKPGSSRQQGSSWAWQHNAHSLTSQQNGAAGGTPPCRLVEPPLELDPPEPQAALFDVEQRIPRYWMEQASAPPACWPAGGPAPTDRSLIHPAHPPAARLHLPRVQAAICFNREFESCAAAAANGTRKRPAIPPTQANLTRLLEPPVIVGQGRWSFARFATLRADGRRKHEGGDSWTVQLKGDQGVGLPARTFDEADGTYTAAFIPLVPGVYSVLASLHYTSCAGYMDPWPGYEAEMTEDPRCWQSGAHIELGQVVVPPATDPATACGARGTGSGGSSSSSGSGHLLPGPVFRSEHHLYWQHNQARFKAACHVAPPFRLGANKTRILLFGDSTTRYNMQAMSAYVLTPCKILWRPAWLAKHWTPEERGRTCLPAPHAEADPELHAAWQGCTRGAPWSDVQMGVVEKEYLGHFNYIEGLVLVNTSSGEALLNGTTPVAKQPSLSIILLNGYGCKSPGELAAAAQDWRATDVVIVNTGPWCFRQISFEQWRRVMDGWVGVLKRTQAAVVWRSSVPVRDHARAHFTWFARSTFQNDARRQLFDGYAEFAMRRVGIPVWAQSAYGVVGKHNDLQHLDAYTTRTTNLELASRILC